MLREEEEEGARLIESGSCCVGNKEVSWEQQSVLFLLATVKGSNGGIGELAKSEVGARMFQRLEEYKGCNGIRLEGIVELSREDEN